MARDERDWRRELVLAYPDLFHPAGDPPPARTLPDVADGWRDLLERVCARMQAALQPGETIRIIQIDKKSGSLRVYWRGDVTPQTAARLYEAIALSRADGDGARLRQSRPSRSLRPAAELDHARAT